MDFYNFDAIQIGLASSDKIREWSHGEVKKPETINYRTLKPERDGLFCERIFGPQKDWECHCGKYKRVRYKGIVCDKCGVEVTRKDVRRERMGHISLAAPVSHIWYFRGIPSRMGIILEMSARDLEKVLYFAAYVVIDPGSAVEDDLKKKDILTEKQFRELQEKYGDTFTAKMGAEAIRELLAEIDLPVLQAELRSEMADAVGQKRTRIIRRLEVVEAFLQSNNRPEWMILDAVPVIPPEIRPMVQLDGGRFATSDLNDLYRRVINRNNRLKRLLELRAPDIIVRNEKRMLQEAVDALIDNGRRGRAVTGPGNRALKSLSEMLRGKQGRFRQNLLGKRVDYSGRSVIVIGPELKMYQCGLPKEMALELFKPFVLKRLVNTGLAHNIKSAKRMVERAKSDVWDVLEDVISDHPVLLNRAPTLHRLGIQAFEPVLVEGRAIKLHPLVCTAFNADFDGDQMPVHVPLSVEAQAEARFLMLSINNQLKPQNGKPVVVPTKDIVLGIYYLSLIKKDEPGYRGDRDEDLWCFRDFDEALMAYQNGDLGIHTLIKVRASKVIDGVLQHKIIKATIGFILLNENIPQDLGFVDRTNPDNLFDLEIFFKTDSKKLSVIVQACIEKHGTSKTAIILDEMKKLGFKYATKGAITISISDVSVPPEKKLYLEEAEERIDKISRDFKRGFISDDERYNLVIETWNETNEKVTKALINNLEEFNPIFMMADSGARGSISHLRQLGGMRGLMFNTAGRTMEIPIRSNFREGLNVLEFFIASHGARKGLADTAIRTADSGYLTRRLVDVSQDVIIRDMDCGTEGGIVVREIRDGNEVIEKLFDRLVGRYLAEDVIDKDGNLIAQKDMMINDAEANDIIKAGVAEIKVRSVLACESKVGICSKCYGSNMATGGPIHIGEAVGIIAAQSIGEPGTQLTMRTFHTGGVAGDDITQGLPRVEEIFEARKPKGLAIISETKGRVSISDNKKKREVTILNDEMGDAKTYFIPYGSRIKVQDGQQIEAGDELTEGSVYPHDILAIKGPEAVQNYFIQEVQRVYRLHGVEINDRHIEVITRQMMRKVRIDDPGDSLFLSGSLVDKAEVFAKNREIEAEGGNPVKWGHALLGITRASLTTDSFLSAASFQETTKVLTEASIKGKIDPLIGLKENVIIGKLIPAGTGMNRYRSIEVMENK